jgi:amidase
VETAERIRKRDVKPTEVIEAAIARAEEAGHLGAVVTRCYEQALARKEPRGSLGGVPTFVKDLTQLRGVATTWGSAAAGEFISRRSDRVVSHLEAAGLVCLGKSATPEFGLTATTEPVGRDACRNPWDPSRSAGGSSGGSACLVAAGVVPIAHASDGGGSIRIPAACCGLVGLKPSRFRMDMEGSNLLPINIATYGMLTRTVRDTVAFYEALETRYRPSNLEPIGMVGAVPKQRLKIGVFVDSPTGSHVETEVRDAVLSAGKLCESLGHTVELTTPPHDAQVVQDFLQYWGFVAWLQKNTAKWLLHRGFDASKFEPWTLGIAKTFSDRRIESMKAIARLRKFTRVYDRVMERFDVLVCPTLAEPAVLLGHLAKDTPFEIIYERLRSYVPFTPVQNVAGAPAVSLPLGKSSNGLPIGIQFAAARGRDRVLLALALALEASAPWERTAPRSKWIDQGTGHSSFSGPHLPA